MTLDRAVLTIWYVNSDNPAAILETEPKADRGYGRKFLAQLNPLFPVTPIGQFPLNRSAQADDHEFYIGGYPGITVVQTVIHADDDKPLRLSELDSRLRNAVPSADVYACAFNEKEGWAGFAHWHEGEEKRVFSGTRYELMEDSGLPLPLKIPTGPARWLNSSAVSRCLLNREISWKRHSVTGWASASIAKAPICR